MEEPEHLRLFVAVPVPDAIKETIAELQRKLQRLLPEAPIRWTDSRQIHLTVRFFGNVKSEHVNEIREALATACDGTNAFGLKACGLGVFPDKRRPRVIWAGIEDGEGALAILQEKIRIATASFGERPDERPFSAHLTLGRIKDIRPREAAALRQFIETEDGPCGEWQVREIELLRSELSSAGARHSVIGNFLLA